MNIHKDKMLWYNTSCFNKRHTKKHFYNMQKIKAMKISIVLYYKLDCEQANW